jgi:hypothetical protein
VIRPGYVVPVNVPDIQRQHRSPNMRLAHSFAEEKLEVAKLSDPLAKQFTLL